MKKESSKKIAIVTGSSSGIGFETSLLLAKNGFIHMPLCVTSTNPRKF